MSEVDSVQKKVFIESGFKTKAGEQDDKFIYVRGLASTYSEDRHGDIVSPKAWNRKTINQFRKNPVLLYAHDSREVIGRVESLEKTDKGLEIEAKIYRSWERSELVEDGLLKAFSIGFYIKDAEYEEDTDVFNIKQVELIEISVVSIPSNRESLFSLKKQLGEDYEDVRKKFIKQKVNKMSAWSAIVDLFKSKTGNEIEVKEDATAEEVIESVKESLESMDNIEAVVEEKVKSATEDLTKSVEALEKAGSVKADDDTLAAIMKGMTTLKQELKTVKDDFAKKESVLEASNSALKKQVEALVSGEKNVNTTVHTHLTEARKQFDKVMGTVTVEGESKYK